jgi:hypothetical protein
MRSSELTVFDYAHSAGGPALFLTAVLLGPLPLTWSRLIRRRWTGWPARLAALLAIWALAVLVAYGDVFWIAWHTRRHCEREAGLEVLRTRRIPTLRSAGEVEAWFGARARLVEERAEAGRGRERVREPLSAAQRPAAFEHRIRSGPAPGRLWRTRHEIRDLASGETLATLTVFQPGYGWLDRWLSPLAGQPPACRGPGLGQLPPASALLLGAVFRPVAAGGVAP